LIELIVVVVILAIIASLAVGLTSGGDYDIKGVTRRVVSDLEYAQSHALTHREKVHCAYLSAEGGYELRLEDGTPLESPDDLLAYREIIGDDATEDGIAIESWNVLTASELIFDETGTPNSDVEIHIRDSHDQLMIIKVSAATGRIKVKLAD
jgi:hypothetical protein